MRVLLNGRTLMQRLDESGLERFRHFLIEFAISYVSRKTNKHVGPSTILGYIKSIQRRLHEFGIQLNLFEGLIFNHPQHGLVTIIDTDLHNSKVNSMYQSHTTF